MVFENKKIRTEWNEQEEDWYFLLACWRILQILPTISKKMRKRDVELGAYLGTNCPQVEMIGQNGLKRKVLARNTKAVLCLIKSIPSKKAEPSQNLLDSFLYC